VVSADDALFRPVRTGNAFEETVERLLQAIRLGVVRTGQRLPAERDLSAKLGVARVTLREAIRALAEAGYVESRRGRYGGTFVTSPPDPQALTGLSTAKAPVDRLEDTLTLRYVLETGAAEAAAARTLTPADRRQLRERLADTAAASLDDYRRTDSRLHLAIAELTASSSLTQAVADARTRINDLLDEIPLLPPNIDHSNDQHERIVGCILGGDAPGARQAMAEHLAGTAALLRGFLS